MPYINISVAKQVEMEKKVELQAEIGANISIIPGKTIDVTTVCIADGLAMFKGGSPFDGAFVDVRLFKSSTEESKREFSKKLFEIFDRVLGVPDSRLQINFTEMPNWGSNGNFV